MRSVTIVVTCTDRKSLPPAPGLRLRDVPGDDVESRLQEWTAALSVAPVTVPLVELYQGEAWTASVRVASAVAQAGWKPVLTVASAGLGLRSVEDRAPGYAATFTPYAEDGVGQTGAQRQQWWHGVQARLATQDLAGITGPVMLVLSEAYARVLQEDLEALAAVNEEVVLFGGAGDVEGVTRVPANGGLRHALGGTMSALNARTAEKWWSLRDDDEPLASAINDQRWHSWVNSVPPHVAHARARVSDSDVREWIRTERKRDPSVSASAAHRRFRDAGLACEQKRFSGLFKEVRSAS